MKMSKLGYFSEFFLFPPLVFIAALLTFRSPVAPSLAALAIVYVAGVIGWTLIEYWLHRLLFHHAPVLAPIHEAHHHSPQELIGTPGWASVLIGVIVVAGPAWAALGLGLGTAATAGLATGYLWFVFVHYAIHQWQPRRGSYLYRARLRHAQHHHVSDEGNFGVTTGLWDHVFRTALAAPRARRARG